MAIANAPVWRHLGGEAHRCGTRLQVMQVAFPSGVVIELRICPLCDRLTPIPHLL